MSVLLIAGVSWVFGTWAFRALGMERGGARAAQALAGACLCGLFILLIGLYSLRVAGVAMYVVAVLGLGYEAVIRDTPAPSTRPRFGRRAGWRGFEYACAGSTAIAAVLSLAGALAPAIGWEEVSIHLPLAETWARLGQIRYVEPEPLSAFATPLHALFAYAIYSDGEFAARILSWLAGIVACAAAYDAGRRVGGRRAGWIAAATLATAPVFYEEAASVSIDLFTAALVVSALRAWMDWREEGDRRALVLAGFLVGSATVLRPAGLLALGMLAVATGIAPLAARFRRVAHAAAVPPADDPPRPPSPSTAQMDFWSRVLEPEETPEPDPFEEEALSEAPTAGPLRILVSHADALGVFALPALVALLPWWFFTLFAGELAIGFPYARDFASLLALAVHPAPGARDPGAFPMFPWDIVMRPHWFDGWIHSPGGLVLFVGVPGLFVGGPWARRLGAFAVAGGAAMYFYSRSGQALLPFFVPMMLVAALAAARMPRWRGAVAALALAYFAYHLGLDCFRAAHDIPGLTRRDPQYTASPAAYRDTYAWVGRQPLHDEFVLSFDPRAHFVPAPTYRNYAAVARLAGRPRAEWQVWLRSRRIRYLVYPQTELEAMPGFAGSRLAQVAEEWRKDPRMFRKVGSFGGTEPGANRVEVYRAAWEE